MNIGVCADLHGVPSRFEKIHRLVEKGTKVILLAGDIARNVKIGDSILFSHFPQELRK